MKKKNDTPLFSFVWWRGGVIWGDIALPQPSYAPNLVIRWRPAINNNDWVTGESIEPHHPPLTLFLSTPLNNIPTLFSVKDPLSLSFLFISGGIFPCEWRWDFFFVFKSKPLSCTNGKCLSSSLSAIIQKRTTVPTDIMKLARAR